MSSVLLLSSSVNLLPQRPVLQSLLPLEPIEDPHSWSWANHPRQGFSYKSKDGLSVEVCLENPKLIATARCSLPLEVCLANPQYISQVGCSGNSYSLDTCIAYPELLTTPPCLASNTYPVDVCLQYPETLTTPSCSYKFPVNQCVQNKFLLDTSKYASQCSFQFPVDVCAKDSLLLDASQCDFEFPLKVCNENPDLYKRSQCQSHLSGSVCASNPGITNEAFCQPFLNGYQPTLFECSDNKENLCRLKLCDKHQFIVKC